MSDLDLPLAVRMMQDGYLMEIQDLKEKNEQLRRERDFYFQQATDNGERAHNAIDMLNAENEKLRELCGELYHELYAARDEHWPASYLGDLEPRDVFPRYDELIELGVEV